MKVDVKITEEATTPYAIIFTDKITSEITRLVNEISNYGKDSNAIIAKLEDTMVILKPEEIFAVRVENEKTFLICENETYRTNKRLYEMADILGSSFMQISKSSLINLNCLKGVEPSFNGVMLLHLKNGKSEYISRKYVPQLKKYLGL